MFVQVFPLDADFPKLARLADPAYVQGVLEAEATVQPTAPSYRITPIRYRPGQRHVLRYDPIDDAGQVDEGGTLFAKVYNSDKGARTFDVAARISDWLAEQNNGISAVQPLTYIAAEGLVLYPRVAGTPLSELLRQPGPATDAYLRAAGAAIRALHQTPESLIELQPHSFAKELKGIVSASEHVHPLLPATSATIAGLIERAQRAARAAATGAAGLRLWRFQGRSPVGHAGRHDADRLRHLLPVRPGDRPGQVPGRPPLVVRWLWAGWRGGGAGSSFWPATARPRRSAWRARGCMRRWC